MTHRRTRNVKKRGFFSRNKCEYWLQITETLVNNISGIPLFSKAYLRQMSISMRVRPPHGMPNALNRTSDVIFENATVSAFAVCFRTFSAEHLPIEFRTSAFLEPKCEPDESAQRPSEGKLRRKIEFRAEIFWKQTPEIVVWSLPVSIGLEIRNLRS